MRHIVYKNAFKKQRQLMIKRGKNIAELDGVIFKLAQDLVLPAANKDHPLSGNWSGFRDCHIQPDWLLIYAKTDTEDGIGELRLEATGTHSDLF